MEQPTILLLEGDFLIRQALAEYLRECGFRVLEAAHTQKARRILEEGATAIDVVFADVDAPGENGFALAQWIRASLPNVEVTLTGTVTGAVEKAGDLCQKGPALTKPYQHHLVLARIWQLLGAKGSKDRAD